ncbi:MAG: O-antigen ligase family protein [Candidatus Scalindua sp.]
MWIVLSLITIVVSIQYVLVFLSEFSIFEMGIKRITTRQPHLALIALPFIYSTILLSGKRINKIMAAIGIFPIVLMVVISQQRGLWLGVIFSLFVFLIFSILRTRIDLKRIIVLFCIFLIFIGLFVAAVILLNSKIKPTSTYTLGQRVESLQNLETDYSLFIRFVEIKRAWRQVGNLSVFGAGIGKHITRFANQSYSNIVDNSYFYIYWKLGWVGVFSFLGIYFMFFRRCIQVLFKSNNKQAQIISLSAISAMSGLFLVALTNVSLVLYRFNLVWALVIASVEILYRLNNQIIDQKTR